MRQSIIVSVLTAIFLSVAHSFAQQPTNKSKVVAANNLAPVASPALQALVDEAAQTALKQFADKGLKQDQLAITLVDLRDPQHPVQGSYRGEERIYPASVVKLFYLVAAHRWLADGRLKETDELKRALHDMIVDSSNDATGYVLDMLTDTTSGRELAPAELQAWLEKRNAVNRYFQTLGYRNINTNQKTFCEDAYGREHFARGPNGENRNKLTTNATARLLAEIATGRAVTPARSQQMMELLHRDFSGQSNDADDQAHGFTALALKEMPTARLWSKAGWTSTTRHDAAYIELPNGARFVLVTFTTDHANEHDIIPAVARVVLNKMR
ncbi:MAG: serine hydrolase [Acidobacteria bacterium]|nr:MAG: serine hydrolase [Acidobacteriota bacterium]